jgi:hypothetical protein
MADGKSGHRSDVGEAVMEVGAELMEHLIYIPLLGIPFIYKRSGDGRALSPPGEAGGNTGDSGGAEGTSGP